MPSRPVIKPVNAFGFIGMNNLPGEPAHLYDQDRKISPKVLLNAVVTDGGVLQARRGITKVGDVGLHSIWGGSVMLGVGMDGVLYRIDGSTLTTLATIPGPRARVHFVEGNGLIYMANAYWKGVYDLNKVRGWGVPLPPSPRVVACPGDLPPGTYTLCYTQIQDGQLSGNGPLVQITWEGVSQGIQLTNLPPGGQCWVTHPNGKELLLAALEGDKIAGQVPTGEPLLSFMCAPPPCFEDFALAFGRIWGIRGKRLHYSFPNFLEWFRSSDFRQFLEPLVMVAPANDGLFINSRKSTFYLSGTDPAKMQLSRIGDGAIPGTLTYAQMPASLAGGAATSQSFGSFSVMPSPVWLSSVGFVVGTHSGHLTQLTDHRLRLTARNQGASLYHFEEGIPRITSSLYGLAVDERDEELDLIFESGSLF